MGADTEDGERLLPALVEELMKKSDLCWLRVPGDEREQVVWHIWRDGAAYLVSGGSEQPAPGIDAADTATVLVRSKETRQRMLAWQARVTTVRPDDPEWEEVVGALLAARLNLRDIDAAAQRWARECVVSRLTPTGALDEEPGTLPDGDLAAPPRPTAATTRRGLPRVLHRRQRRGPDLR